MQKVNPYVGILAFLKNKLAKSNSFSRERIKRCVGVNF